VQAPPQQSLKVYARAGAIIPEAPIVQNAHEAPAGPLLLTVWPGPDCSGSLYLDDGESFAFQSGKSRRLQLRCEPADASVSVQCSSLGDYPPWWKTLRIVIHDVPRAPRAVVDEKGAKLLHEYDAAKKTLVVSLPGSLADFRVTASW
jgi:alpha-glucosidase